MNAVMENLGWFLFLAAVLAAGTVFAKTFLNLLVESASTGKYLTPADTFVWMIDSGFDKIRQNMLATAISIGTFVLILLFTESSVFAALGFSTMSYLIGAVLTPFFMKRAKIASSVESAPAVSQVKIDPDLH